MAMTTAPKKGNGSKALKAPPVPPKRLANARLLKLVARHRPPQSWFEQTDVPFTPTKD
jgi:hypothetical protein